jgi:hypothetical protein
MISHGAATPRAMAPIAWVNCCVVNGALGSTGLASPVQVKAPARRPHAVPPREALQAGPDQPFAVLRVAHPAVVPMLADLALLEAPDRALAHAVHRPVRVRVAQMSPLRPVGIIPAPVTACRARHGWRVSHRRERHHPPSTQPRAKVTHQMHTPLQALQSGFEEIEVGHGSSASSSGAIPMSACLHTAEPVFRQPFPADEAVVIAAR